MAQHGSVSSPEEKLDLIKRNLQVRLSKGRYNWNIVESGIKQHKPKPLSDFLFFICVSLGFFFFGIELLFHLSEPISI